MNYRLFIPEDLPRLLELALEFETSPFSFDEDFQRLSDHYEPFFAKEMLLQDRTTTLVAETEGIVVAFISFAPNSVASKVLGKKIATILLLVVSRDYRNRGIAKRLLSMALRFFRNNQVEVVTVGTDLYNYPALHVYESFGFKIQMAWHIYRFYLDSQEGNLSDLVEVAETRFLHLFKKDFERPVSLLSDPRLDKEKLRDFLFENVYRSLIKGSVHALMWKKASKPQAWIQYQEDRIALSTLGLKRGIYRVLDLWGARDLKILMLRDLLFRLKGAKMIEYWIRAENKEQIDCAESAGLHLAYTGVSLHLHILKK